MLLFYSWRNEQSDIKGRKETYESMYNTVRKIVESKAKQFEHNVEKLDKASYKQRMITISKIK